MSQTPATPIVGHTPGPWRVGHGADLNRNWKPIDQYLVISSGDGEWSNTVAGRIPTEADAHLIAAAPEGLEAARFALSVLQANPVEMSERMAIEKLQAFITKATGGEM